MVGYLDVPMAMENHSPIFFFLFFEGGGRWCEEYVRGDYGKPLFLFPAGRHNRIIGYCLI